MAKKTRKELQSSFKQGSKPSGDDFKDLIDSTLNITEDGIEKGSGTDPLKIKANGAEENLLDFYTGETNTWRINQKPNSDKQGLNFSASGSSKLFIESSSGNVGISTNKPTAKLHVQQTNNEDALRVDDESGDNTPFIVNKDGNVGIGTTSPTEKLEIKLTGGDGQQTNFLSLFNDGFGKSQESRIVWKNGSEKKDAAAIASRPGSLYNAGDLRFQTASAGILKEQMIIGTTGNVGIGTTSPAAKLSINGGLHVGGDSDPGDKNLLVDGTATIQGVLTVNNTVFLNGANNKNGLTVDFQGNVGIGTTSIHNPQSWNKVLDIYAEDASARLNVRSKSVRTCIFSHDDWFGARGVIGTESEHPLTFATKYEHRMTISTNGNVGIGTYTPAAKLSINGGLHVGGDSDPGDKNLLVDGTANINNTLTVGGNTTLAGVLTVNNTVSLNGTNNKNGLTVDSQGNVGIGTTSIHNPQSWNKVLDIYAEDASARLNVRSKSVRTCIFSHDDWFGARGVIGTESEHPLTFATKYEHRMTIGTNGNVGIGTYTPAAKLSINGGLHVGGDSDPGDKNLLVDGTANINNTLTVGGNTTLAGVLTVNNTVSLNGANNKNGLTVDSQGNVGIGTTSIHNPQSWNKVLDIYAEDASARLNVRSKSVRTCIFSHDDWFGARGVIGTESEHPLTFATKYEHRMTIGTNGNVGIGTYTPAAKLSINGGLHVGGDSDPGDNNLLVDGNIYSSINSSQQRNYEIYLRGSAADSTEGDNNDVQINKEPIEKTQERGINTVILYPNGTFKNNASHDLWADPNQWDNWADWVNANVTDGDIVAVTSRDALNKAPRGGSAEKLLNSIAAIEAFQCVKGHARSPYALLFIKGRTGALEVSRRYQEGNAHIRTTYYHLLNNSSGSVISGMIIMWYGDTNNIPIGWVLCDGENGTPDLRSHFIKSSEAAGNLSYQAGLSDFPLNSPGANAYGGSNSPTSSGFNRPKSYTISLIMKL